MIVQEAFVMSTDIATPTYFDEVATEYTGDQVKLLRDAAHIRHRPGMYIGNTGAGGLHQLVSELVHNSIDEALAGFCKNIFVRLHVDGSAGVEDDGRGIPVDEHPIEKRPTVEVLMTEGGAGPNSDNNAYHASPGLDGFRSPSVPPLG